MIKHDLKFIYIHIPKTGGSTMGVAFAWKLEPHIPIDAPFEVKKVEQETETHLPAILIKNSFPNIFNAYYKVCFVRNSWDLIVSAYFYLKTECDLEYDFNTWVNNDFIGTPVRERNIFLNPIQLDWITDEEDNIIVDYIGRFEYFKKDLKKIYKKIKIKSIKIPHINKTEHRHYSHYYNEKSREIIRQKYRKDIDFFGFKFEFQKRLFW